jgi:hypothetical protein
MTEMARSLRESLDRIPTSQLVEYLAERLGGSEELERGLAGQLPPDTRSLLEMVVERLNLVGHCRLEIDLDNGRVCGVWLHEKLGARALENRSARR